MQIEKLLSMCLAHGTDFGGAGGRSTAPSWDRLEPLDPIAALAYIRSDCRALLCKSNPELVSATDIARLNGMLLKELEMFMGINLRNLKCRSEHHGKDERAVAHNKDKQFAEMAAIIRTAYNEYIDDKVCLTCKGKGQVRVSYQDTGVIEESCPDCVGLGWKAWSNSRRAESLGKDRESKRFLTVLLPAQEHMLSVMRARYREAQAAFQKALFGEDESERRAA